MPASNQFTAAAAPITEASTTREHATIALIGNPNTGKTTLFNALTGFRRHVANYPGVTVEIARGPIRGIQRPTELLDLPGTYSLAAHSPDETVVCDALRGRVPDQARPDVVIAIVDASNLKRNLYLLCQLLDSGHPVVVALTMNDVAAARGLRVDGKKLAQRLGVPVIAVDARQPQSVAPLAQAVEDALNVVPPPAAVELPQPLTAVTQQLLDRHPELHRSEALRIITDQAGHAEQLFLGRGGDGALVNTLRVELAAQNVDPTAAEIRARYAWVDRVLGGVVERTLPPGNSWSHRIDAILTHRVGGTIFLLALLYVVFTALYSWAGPLMDGIEWSLAAVGDAISDVLPTGIIRSLVLDGLIAGVGGVLVFLPQILILFLFIAILEDCGYLARAAFLVDRLMRPLGLSGRAFIPLLSSFACAVPAIMGTRAIADRRERFITILIAPFMSCSARLPVYVLLIGALVPPVAWLGGWARLDALVMLAMYLVGVSVAIPIAWLLRHTTFSGPASGFVLELPSYKLPRLRTVGQRVYMAGKDFVIRAGSIILIASIVIWALGYFPRSAATQRAVQAQQQKHNWSDSEFETHLASAYLRDSYLGRLGQTIEPAIRPLGWDWRIGVGVLASFPAREVIVATLGTIFNLEAGSEEDTAPLEQAIQEAAWPDTGRPLFTLPVALSLMVFFALCAQCVSTLAVIRRETGTWLWPLVSFGGMTAIAYVAALLVAQVGAVLS